MLRSVKTPLPQGGGSVRVRYENRIALITRETSDLENKIEQRALTGARTKVWWLRLDHRSFSDCENMQQYEEHHLASQEIFKGGSETQALSQRTSERALMTMERMAGRICVPTK